MSEISNYKGNLQDFVNTFQDSYIEKVIYDEDLDPTFDKASFPFQFSYCFSVTFVTNKGNFLVRTSLTTFGYETFWIETIEFLNKGTSEKFINSKVKSVSSIKEHDYLPYKLAIELERSVITIYAAEIQVRAGNKHEIIMNDEMVFVFEEELEAKRFEASNNYA